MSSPGDTQILNFDELERAINGLFYAFLWKTSPQGHDYWYKVHKQLVEIRNACENSKEHPDARRVANEHNRKNKPDYSAITRSMLGR